MCQCAALRSYWGVRGGDKPPTDPGAQQFISDAGCKQSKKKSICSSS